MSERGANSEPRRPTVAFVLSRFPCYDEAFILREIHALSLRMEIRIFALRQATGGLVHDQAQALLDRVVAPPYFWSWRLWAAHLRFLLVCPGRYLRAFCRLVSGNLQSPIFLLKNLAFFPKAVYLADWAGANGITHIHAGWATFPASAAMLASEIAGVPYSFSGHAHDLYLDTTHLKEKIERSAFVTTCTVSNKAHLERIAPDYPKDRLLVLHHGINLSDFLAPLAGRGPEILSVGTLVPHKGFPYLISALAGIRDKGISFHCTIVGGGPMESEIRQQVSGLGLDSAVSLRGPLKQTEVLREYKRAAIMVLMAQSEWHWGIPNVIIEALASNVAVITTRFGSVEELVKDGETGLLVPSKDPATLAAALERLLLDSPFREALAGAGHRAVAADFNLEDATEVYAARFHPVPAGPERYPT